MAHPLPNQYRESRTNERPDTEQDPDNFSGIADSWRLGWMGQLGNQVEETQELMRSGNSNFDPFDHVPEGYEAYAGAFSGARSTEGIEIVRRNIDDNLAIRARREARGFGSTLVSDLGAGVLDPVNLVAPPLRGAGFVGGALRGMGVIGTTGAATEIVRGTLDPTSPIEETALGIGFSYVLGGVIGGGVGSIPAPHAPARAAQPSRRVEQPIMPVEGRVRVTSGIGPRARPRTPQGPGSAQHRGIDIDGETGDPVRAPLSGTVLRVGHDSGRGNYVEIDHGNGLVTKYFHLQGSTVRPGQRIGRGTVFGTIGSTGRSTGSHLHYEAWLNGTNVDPRRIGQVETVESGAMPTGAGVDPVAAVSYLERLAPPREVELDGRGVRVVVGPTGRYDDAGNYIPAAYSPAREAPVETASLDGSRLPSVVAIQREIELPAFTPEETPDGLARVEIPLASEPMRAAPEAPPGAVARARLVGLAESDRQFFGNLKSTPLYDEAGTVGLENLSLAKRGRLASSLADELEGDEARLLALFGGRLPARVNATSIRARINEIVKERVRLVAEGGPIERGRIRSDMEIESPEGRPDSGWVLGPDGEERFIEPEAPVFNTMDEAMLEMRRMDREKAARDMDSNEIEDAPFTVDRSPGDDMPDEFAEHIRIDVDAIVTSFDKKPWTTPRFAGVLPLPADTFRSPHEWVNFVFLHEREHVFNPRRADETAAEFENRVNDRALEELRGGQQPFSPENNKFEHLILRPTPIGQLMALVPEDARIMHDIQDLAGDMGTQLIANRKGGAASAGGSVFQRTLRWIGTTSELRAAIRAEWLRYVQGTAPRSHKAAEIEAMMARIPVIGKAAREGKMSLSDFRLQVGRAQISNDLDVVPEARVVATRLNHIFTRFEEEARALGVFERTRDVGRLRDSLTRRADALQERIDRSAAALSPEIRANLDEIVAKWRNEAEQLSEIEAKPVMPRGETRYFPRMWHVGNLTAKKEEALELLRSAYVREGSSPEKADMQARGAYDAMVGEPNGDFMPGRPSASKQRSVPLTNEEAHEFIVTDPELVLGIYSRRMGSAIEMTRRFGDPAGLDHEDELLADLLLRGVTEPKAQKAMQIWRDARDRVAGGFHGKDPMSWDNRTARFLKNTASLAVMGKIIYSQIVDVARAIGTVGPRPMWKSLVAITSGDLARFEVGTYAKQAGEALDLVLARTNARMIEADDAILVTRETGVERAVVNAQAPFFMANLMIPFTVIMKEWTSVAAGHIILEEARVVTRAIHAGAVPDPDMVRRLAGTGIDQQDAQLLASMPFETTDGGLNLANVLSWEGDKGQRARDLFLGAVSGEVRRGVITPGPLDKPAIMDGVFHTKKGRQRGLERVSAAQAEAEDAYAAVRALREADAPEEPLLAAVARLSEARGELSIAKRALGRAGRIEAPLASLPLQLKSFVLASGGKLLHGLVNRRDRAKLTGLVALMMGGVLSTYLKNSSTGRWAHMSWPEVVFESFNNSGLGAYFSDVAESIDNTFHLLGEDRPGIQDEVGGIGGVSPGIIAGFFEAFISDDLTNTQRAGAIRRAVPLNNLIWWDGLVRKITRFMASSEQPVGNLNPGAMGVDDESPFGALLGFTAEDERVPVDAPDPVVDQVEQVALDIENLVDAYERDIAPRLRRGRTRGQRGSRLPEGMLRRGNIDLSRRPVVRNRDGTVSTVLSMSIGTEQGEVLIPRISDTGAVMSEREAVAAYRDTGRHLGVFRTPDQATAYAVGLSADQGRRRRTRLPRPPNATLYRSTPIPAISP